MAGKKSGKIGRGLLWLAAVILLLVGILFFAFTALVYQGQLPFGYQITLVEQSGCDIPLTDTLVLTQQQEQYSSGDSVVFFSSGKGFPGPGLRHLTAAGRGIRCGGSSRRNGGSAKPSHHRENFNLFPHPGQISGLGQRTRPKFLAVLGVHRIGCSVIGLIGAVDDIRFPKRKRKPLASAQQSSGLSAGTRISPDETVFRGTGSITDSFSIYPGQFPLSQSGTTGRSALAQIGVPGRCALAKGNPGSKIKAPHSKKNTAHNIFYFVSTVDSHISGFGPFPLLFFVGA